MIKDTSATDIVFDDSKALITRFRFVIALIVIAIFSVMIMGLMKWSRVEQSVSSERLRFASVVRGDFIRDIAVQGRVVAARSPTLYSPANGIIKLNIRLGDSVDKDQILATIDSPSLRHQLLQEQSILSKLSNELQRQSISTRKLQLKSQQSIDLAMVRLDAAKREMRRADGSIDSQAISQLDYEKSKDDLNTAELQYEHAKQDAVLEKESLEFELKTRELDLDTQKLTIADIQRQIDELSIRAPVSGVIGNLVVEERENVIANMALLTVVDLSAFEVEIKVPESYADDIGISMDAELSFNGELLAAKVTAISPEVVNNQVAGRLKFVNDSVVGLKQNQRLAVRIFLESKKDVLKIKRGPFFESGGGQIVYLVNDGVAVKTAISTGSTSISEIEILGGLAQGDRIVISSHDVFNKANIILIN